jgi:CheY-like chemotaxis protein
VAGWTTKSGSPNYWPEFGQKGKEKITVRQLLAHQAGLFAIDEPVNRSVVADLDRLAVVLARQKPAWEHTMKHVLVVDDDVAVANAVATALRGYHVTIAHNGAEALALAAHLPLCALLITDYLMPAMTGDELAGRLQERQPAVKTLLLTGYGAFIEVDESTMDAAKPFQPGVLRRIVAILIGPARR